MTTTTRRRRTPYARLFLIFFVLLCFSTPTLAARLPVVGGDTDSWGAVLNEFLGVTMDETGALRNGTVGALQILYGAITGDHILDGSVTGDDLASESVGGDHIQEDSITSGHINDGSIGGSDLEEDAIDSSSLILDGVITVADLANDAVDSHNIRPGAIVTDHILDGTLIGADIDEETLTGSHILDGSLSSEDIADESLTSDDMEDGTLSGDDIASDAALIVDSIEATTFFLGLEVEEDACADPGCNAVASCTEGSIILFGMRSDSSMECVADPSQCNEFCTVGEASCSAVSALSAASVTITCARLE